MQNTITKSFSVGSDMRVEVGLECPVEGAWETVLLDTRSGEAIHPCGAVSVLDAQSINEAVAE